MPVINTRNSAHELLRILAMFIIVWYHILAYFLHIFPHETTNDFYIEAAIPTLHIGVILFVLISGYYGIKPSIKGFVRLLIITMVYYLPLQFVSLALEGRIFHPKAILSTLKFITNTPYWFIRTYLYLFLCAPLITSFITVSGQKRVNYLLVVLGAISVYFGSTHGDPSISDGKNLVNFIFLYLLGHSIKHYLPQIKIKQAFIICAYLLLNTCIIVSLLVFPRESTIGSIIWNITCPYCSPVLILNAVLLFVVFSRITLYSKPINAIASSMFAVYLLHCHPFIIRLYQPYVSEWLQIPLPAAFALSALISLLIVGLSVLIDKLLIPVWIISDKVSMRIQDKFET